MFLKMESFPNGAKASAEGEPERADSEDSVISESEDEEEEEPLLKYRRVRMTNLEDSRQKSAYADLRADDPSTCVDVTTKIVCVGTFDGRVHVLDLGGHIHRSLHPHKRPVTGLSIDKKSEFVASCSDDGTVVISGVHTTAQSESFSYHRPVKAVQIDPYFASNGERSFASGGLAGKCLVHERGWFGSSTDKVLHEGQGPVRALAWADSLLAWGNDWGIKIYDFHRKERISYVERPQADEGALGDCACHLCWENEDTLIIGWLRHVMVVSIVEASRMQTQRTAGGRYAEITSLFRTDYEVCFIVLAHHVGLVQQRRKAMLSISFLFFQLHSCRSHFLLYYLFACALPPPIHRSPNFPLSLSTIVPHFSKLTQFASFLDLWNLAFWF